MRITSAVLEWDFNTVVSNRMRNLSFKSALQKLSNSDLRIFISLIIVIQN